MQVNFDDVLAHPTSFLRMKSLIGLQRNAWPEYQLSVFQIPTGCTGSTETLAVAPGD